MKPTRKSRNTWTEAYRCARKRICGNHLPPQALPARHQLTECVVRGYAERNAINAPIQGSAADIIKVAMSLIYRRLQSNNLKAKMILQVHDELNFSVPEAEKEIIQKIVIEEMERAYRMLVP